MIDSVSSKPPGSERRRLASWSLHPVRLPYRRSVVWASHVATHSEFLILRLCTDDGIVGVAEMHVNPNWFGVNLRSLTVALEDIFLPMFADLDLMDRSAFLKRVQKIPENMSAKALIDNALWDLSAAASGEPFWKARGEKRPPVCWVLTRQAPQLMMEEAADVVERYGFRTLKLKGGQGVDVDVEAVRMVRSAVGADVRIFLDCNGHYDAAATPGYLAAMAAEGVVAMEDPCPVAPDADFTRLQAEGALPIVLDADCTTARQTKLFAERGARALALKLGRVGFSESFEMAGIARRHGCAVHVGFSGESELGSLAALAVTKQLTSPDSWLPSETTYFLMLGERVTIDPVAIADGRITLPDVAGLHELIDWERVERFRA